MVYMEMIQFSFALLHMIEMWVGVWILYHLYPEWRRPSKWVKFVWIVTCIIFCFLYTLEAIDSFISNLSILLFALEFSAAYYLFFKVKFREVFAIEMLYMTSLSFFQLPILILEGILSDRVLISLNRGSRTGAELIWCIVLLAAGVFLFIKKKFLEHYKAYIKLLLFQHGYLMLLVACAQFLLLTYNMWLGKQGFQTGDLIMSVLLICGIFLCLHYMLLRLAYREIQMNCILLENFRRQLRDHNDEIHKMYKKSSLQLHEHYHTLEYLYFCIKDNKCDEAEKFLKKQLIGLKAEKQRVWTGLAFLDFMINYKKQTMDEMGITFRLHLDVYEYPFAETEFGIILGNLLDNAIEACEKCVQGEKEIYLRIWNVKRMFMLDMINSSSKRPVLKGNKFVTDKADKNLHGIGVEQVRRIVENYGGDISFQYDEAHFEVKIIAAIMQEEGT